MKDQFFLVAFSALVFALAIILALATSPQTTALPVTAFPASSVGPQPQYLSPIQPFAQASISVQGAHSGAIARIVQDLHDHPGALVRIFHSLSVRS
jgi:hypothetical protein